MRTLTENERALMINKIRAFCHQNADKCEECPLQSIDDCTTDVFTTDIKVQIIYDYIRHSNSTKDTQLQRRLIKEIDSYCNETYSILGCANEKGKCVLYGKNCFSTDLNDLKELYTTIKEHKNDS